MGVLTVIFVCIRLCSGQGAVQDACIIEGVVNQSGSETPLSRALVSIYRKNASAEPPIMTTSDAEGRFRFNSINPGVYVLEVRRTGYVGQTYGSRGRNKQGMPLTLKPGQILSGLTVSLVPTGVIAGHVFGEYPEDGVGVRVAALQPHYVDGHRRLVVAAQSTTNDLGEYRIYGLAPGQYYVSAAKNDPGDVSQPRAASAESRFVPTLSPNVFRLQEASAWRIEPGAELLAVDITLKRCQVFRIRGHVAGLEEAQNARVMLHPLEETFDAPDRVKEVAPRANGAFELTGILPGTYILSVLLSRGGSIYTGSRRLHVVDADLVEGIVLSPSAGTRVTGTVRFDADRPVDANEVSVVLRRTRLTSYNNPVARVNNNGMFAVQADYNTYTVGMTGLPDNYCIKAIRVGNEVLRDGVLDLSDGDVSTVELSIVVTSRTGSIEGVVKDDNDHGVSGSVVILIPTADGKVFLAKEAVTGDSGLFTLQGIAVGEYTLMAFDDVEPSSVRDPEFVKEHQESGNRIVVEERQRKEHNLRISTVGPQH
jgi:uncharacterized protein (DUF2141 family)